MVGGLACVWFDMGMAGVGGENEEERRRKPNRKEKRKSIASK